MEAARDRTLSIRACRRCQAPATMMVLTNSGARLDLSLVSKENLIGKITLSVLALELMKAL